MQIAAPIADEREAEFACHLSDKGFAEVGAAAIGARPISVRVKKLIGRGIEIEREDSSSAS